MGTLKLRLKAYQSSQSLSLFPSFSFLNMGKRWARTFVRGSQTSLQEINLQIITHISRKSQYFPLPYTLPLLTISPSLHCTLSISEFIHGPPSRPSGKESTCNVRDLGLIPGLGRSPAGGHGKPLQCSCLENPMDRGTWQAAVHRATQNQTQLKRVGTHWLHILGLVPQVALPFQALLRSFLFTLQTLNTGLLGFRAVRHSRSAVLNCYADWGCPQARSQKFLNLISCNFCFSRLDVLPISSCFWFSSSVS